MQQLLKILLGHSKGPGLFQEFNFLEYSLHLIDQLPIPLERYFCTIVQLRCLESMSLKRVLRGKPSDCVAAGRFLLQRYCVDFTFN